MKTKTDGNSRACNLLWENVSNLHDEVEKIDNKLDKIEDNQIDLALEKVHISEYARDITKLRERLENLDKELVDKADRVVIDEIWEKFKVINKSLVNHQKQIQELRDEIRGMKENERRNL